MDTTKQALQQSLSHPLSTDPALLTTPEWEASLNALATLTKQSDTISLDNLLAESLLEREAADHVKAGRAVIARGGLPAAEAAAIAAQVRSWEARREWRPLAAVAMFSRQRCRCCGTYSTQFMGWFQRQTHRDSGIDRWISHIRPVDDSLPWEAKYQDSWAEICEACAEHIGFEVEE